MIREEGGKYRKNWIENAQQVWRDDNKYVFAPKMRGIPCVHRSHQFTNFIAIVGHKRQRNKGTHERESGTHWRSQYETKSQTLTTEKRKKNLIGRFHRSTVWMISKLPCDWTIFSSFFFFFVSTNSCLQIVGAVCDLKSVDQKCCAFEVLSIFLFSTIYHTDTAGYR